MGRPRRPPARRGRSDYVRPIRQPLPVNGYSIRLVSPNNGAVWRDPRPEIEFVPTSVLADPVDVQIQWRTQAPYLDPNNGVAWLPEVTYEQTFTSLSSGDIHSVEPPVDLTFRSWYYRLRAGRAATNTWGEWTETLRRVEVQAPLGSVTSYLDINIGVARVFAMDAVAYLDLNIGIEHGTMETMAATYADLNIGIYPSWRLTSLYSDMNVHPELVFKAGAVYADLNIVAERPDPVIWWIRPEQGKEGYVFNIYGHGFGSFQGEYNGEVRLGNLVCSIASWSVVPAKALASTVQVSGTPRATESTTDIPYVLLRSDSHVVQAGDIIEFDMRWESPAASRLDIFPYFSVSGSSTPIGYGSALLNDTTGDAWVSDQPEAYGAWHHRRFVVPPEHYLVGRTLSSFGVSWYGSSGASPTRTGSIRSFVVRNPDESPALWITGDDQASAPELTYVANTAKLIATEYTQDGHVIEHGQALAPDVITPEYGWIVAIVPSGATSSMVRVVLEDD